MYAIRSYYVDLAKKRVASTKKKKLKNIPVGVAHIYSTFNNTIVSITDNDGKVVTWKSGGTSGFKETNRITSYNVCYTKLLRDCSF